MHATTFLRQQSIGELPAVVVAAGPIRYLQQNVTQRIRKEITGEDDFGTTQISGKTADFTTVSDELKTVSMWGDRRLVIIDEADEFVSGNRSALEKYVAEPARKSVLMLLVKMWPKTTKLAKAVAMSGLTIECSELKGAELVTWLRSTSSETHDLQMTHEAANLMIELAGSDLGKLSQELNKLAVYVGERGKVTGEDVTQLVGGWKTQVTWDMTNAVRDGRLGEALSCLDKLLMANEAPQKLLGGINFVFRKYAAATDIARDGRPLEQAMKAAGIFPRDIRPAMAYLRRIGRPHAEQIVAMLITADGDLKGGTRINDRALLEQLLVRLSGVQH